MKVGFLGVAHMHAHGYASALRAHTEVSEVLVWDVVVQRAQSFASKHGFSVSTSPENLCTESDAVIITSCNVEHMEALEWAHHFGKPALCEKPIIALESHRDRLLALISNNAKIMTAFPCRYSLAFQRALTRVRAGDIGEITAICATNRGRCPHDWFVQKALSGGGAMIDHVVHVADLLNVLLGEEPKLVVAQVGNNMYGETWEDTAMLSLGYESGVFVTLDSSWSRPSNYKTWGDVTMNIVGEKGVIEVDLFGQQFESYGDRMGVVGFGADLDAMLVNDFLLFAQGKKEVPITAMDGYRAVDVALRAYASVETGQPVTA